MKSNPSTTFPSTKIEYPSIKLHLPPHHFFTHSPSHHGCNHSHHLCPSSSTPPPHRLHCHCLLRHQPPRRRRDHPFRILDGIGGRRILLNFKPLFKSPKTGNPSRPICDRPPYISCLYGKRENKHVNCNNYRRDCL